eukprot:gene15583-6852_t
MEHKKVSAPSSKGTINPKCNLHVSTYCWDPRSCKQSCKVKGVYRKSRDVSFWIESQGHWGKDWESVQSKYVDIAERMTKYLRNCGEADRVGKDYPHSPDDLSKEKVSSKLKAVRTKYRNAVDSGHGDKKEWTWQSDLAVL